MELRQLRYVLAVVDHGGFTRAAAAEHIAQPSLSQAIRTLERELGVELFHRLGRRVTLTPPARSCATWPPCTPSSPTSEGCAPATSSWSPCPRWRSSHWPACSDASATPTPR